MVTITLGPGEYAADLKGNSEELAASILKAVANKADPEKDHCHVTITDSGSTMPQVEPTALPFSVQPMEPPK
jgi:hypothetical protein